MMISRALVTAATVVAFVVSTATPLRAQIDTTPPVATISTTSSLSGPEEVAFDEAARSVDSANIVLEVSGSGEYVSVRFACTGAGGVAVSCENGPVLRVALAPRGPLVAGQTYSVTVNPSGATPVTDMSGNQAATTSATFRASVSEQETSLGVLFGWRPVQNDKALGGSYRAEFVRAALSSFSFSGTSVNWYTKTGPAEGRAAVYVDGAAQGTVDNYSASERFVRRSYRGFSGGTHRLIIRVLGSKRSASRGTWIAVDGIGAAGVVHRTPAGTYRWGLVADDGALGDQYAVAGARGSSARFTFRGTGIDWYTKTGPDQGRADVYVDGSRRATFDNYASSSHFGVRRTISGLRDEVHALKIVVLGAKASASRGTLVSIDSWRLRAPTTAFKRLGVWIDIWDYGVNRGLDPATEIPKLRDHGVRTIFIETARSSDSSAFVRKSALPGWIERAHAAGIKIVGWYLPWYCDTMDTDVSRTVAIARYRTPNGQAFDGLGIDIEYRRGCDYDNHLFNAGIVEHLRRVRAGAGGTYPIVAITPAPLQMEVSPSSWAGFPWASIGRYSDAVAPMGYWSYRTDCDTKPEHCAYGYSLGNTTEARRLTGLPVHLIGGVGDDVTTSEVADFVKAATNARAYGGSLYDLRTTKSSYWTSLEKLTGL
ncbi:MAG: Ig-like domain-containing protein [Actinomycetota bacterium]